MTPRVAIVGAGPHGLTTAVHLRSLGVASDELTVIDPSGTWLDGWTRAFSSLGIAHLRSPSVHHPHPDPFALADFARSRGRNHELHHRYGLPSTALFADFCASMIADLDLGSVHPAAVTAIAADGQLTLDDGTVLTADHVVWATDPSRLPEHTLVSGVSDHWATRPVWRERERVAVIGGGLSAAHLVMQAAAAGVHVEWVTRRPVVERDFDTDPGWLGPKEMLRFDALRDPHDRLRAVVDARGGGTVPPWMMRAVRRLEASGVVCRRAGEVEADADADGVRLAVAGRDVRVDRLVWATGSVPDIAVSPALVRLARSLGTQTVGGRPVLDTSLRLPGTRVHIAGRLAQLSLGPTAGNLAGARRVAARVVGAVCGMDAMFALADA